MATIQDFRAWYDRDLGRFARWETSVQVLSNVAVNGSKSLHIRIFTDKNRYSISVREPVMRKVKDPAAPACRDKYTVSQLEKIMDGNDRFVEIEPDGTAMVYPAMQQFDGGYLGCISTSRKWRAGEDWNRGSDLKDGPFTEETWHAILADIVSYELVTIAKDVREPRAPQPLTERAGERYSHTELVGGFTVDGPAPQALHPG